MLPVILVGKNPGILQEIHACLGPNDNFPRVGKDIGIGNFDKGHLAGMDVTGFKIINRSGSHKSKGILSGMN